jgi:hypothetical protein
MRDNDFIFFNNIELQDEEKISKTEITHGSTLEVRTTNEQKED